MNKRQKELLKLQLKDEREIQRNLKIIYEQALEDVDAELLRLRGSDQTQSKIYQIKYQEQLKKRVNQTIDTLSKKQWVIVNDHLKNAYKRSFIGTMYDFHGQGVPFLVPVDEKRITKALFTNSKIKEGLYKKLGKDARVLKRQIANEITRGLASGKSYHDIARNLNLLSQIGLGKANRIVRTEGHRIQNEAAHDAGKQAKKEGADIVKQWDATLDSRTRTSHRILDGQIRELDEPFTLDRKEADHPGGFGIASEDINCRCTILHRARWALDDDELSRLQDRAKFYGLDKPKNLEDFQNKYLDATNGEITDKEVGALNRYISSDSYIINEKLRRGIKLTEEEQEWKRTLDYAIVKLPKYEGEVYRSISSMMIADMEKFNADHEIGRFVRYRAYTSASTSVYDEGMDIQFVIMSKDGKDIRKYNESEQEILFKRESVFVVKKREGNTIWLTEV